jgi:hypothetical protein
LPVREVCFDLIMPAATPHRLVDRLVACPVSTNTHSPYFSLGDNRRRGFLEVTVRSDIIDSLPGASGAPSDGRVFPTGSAH